jgi:glycosyltransferase involved in cell wall biosynthesis
MRREIFILTPEPPEVLGGMETFIREQIRGLQERGYAVRVFHRQNSDGASLLRLVQKISPFIAGSLVGLLIGRAAQRAMHPGVAAVISHSMIGWYPLHLPGGCRDLHFHHGTYRGYAEVNRRHISLLGYWRMKWWDSMVLERLSVRGRTVLCNSGQTAQEVFRFYGCESHIVALIASPQFVPLDQAASRRALGLPAEARVGVFVGSLHPMKNFSVVRALIQALPQVHWLIVLRGELPKEPFAAPNVHILQDLPPTSLPTVYAAGDFSLCPSVYEPFGYVVAEALACGTPVIAAPGGASSLFLSDPSLHALLVPHAGDTQAFLAAVQEVLARPAFYRHLVLEHARPAVEQWMSPKNWWRRFFELTGLPDTADQTEAVRLVPSAI